MTYKCASIGLLNIYLYCRASLYLYEMFLFNNINTTLYYVRYSWIHIYEYNKYSEFWAVVFIFINTFCCKYLYDTVRNITGTIKSLYNAIFGVRFFSYRKYRLYGNLINHTNRTITYLIYLCGNKTSVKYYILSIARLSQCR